MKVKILLNFNKKDHKKTLTNNKIHPHSKNTAARIKFREKSKGSQERYSIRL